MNAPTPVEKPRQRFTAEGHPIFQREARIDDVSVIQGDNGQEDRRVVLSFSSEEPVLRVPWFSDPYFEILGHDDGEVDLYRMGNGAAVFYNHMTWHPAMRLGAVLKAWLEKGRAYAEVRISSRDEVAGFWTDIRDEILSLISVGYVIHKTQLQKSNDEEPDEYRVINWEPVEISFVGVPADPTVGVGRTADPVSTQRTAYVEAAPLDFMQRKTGDEPMTGPTTTTTTEDPAVAAAAAAAAEAARKAELNAAQEQARIAEATRQTEIRTAFDPHRAREGFAEIERTCLDDANVDAGEARKRLLDKLGEGFESLGDGNGQIEAGQDVRDKFREGAALVLAVRAGILGKDKPKPDLRGNEYASYRLVEMARASLRINNLSDGGFDPLDMVGRAFHSTSDFPHILEETSRVSMGIGWDEAPEIFDRFTGRGNLSDFKIHKRVSLSSYSDLEKVPEGGEFHYGTFIDEGEPIVLGTYGSLFAITRQAIINDDLDAFSATPRKQGRAARRLVGDLVFDVLFANAPMADGTALFHADHKNLGTVNQAPDLDSLSEAYGLMLEQKDAQGNAINIDPKFVLVQPTQYLKTKQIIESTQDPGSTIQGVMNPVNNIAEVLKDSRMSKTAARRGIWYMLGDPAMFDTIQVAYLNGNDQPMLESKDGWKIDGTEFKVRIDVGVKAIAWRALVMNPGK